MVLGYPNGSRPFGLRSEIRIPREIDAIQGCEAKIQVGEKVEKKENERFPDRSWTSRSLISHFARVSTDISLSCLFPQAVPYHT